MHGVYWHWIRKNVQTNGDATEYRSSGRFLTNSYLVGLAKGKIYQGKLKNLCVPGLNCYSCPGSSGGLSHRGDAGGGGKLEF